MSEEKVRLLGLLLAAGFALVAAWLLLSILFRLVTGKGLGARAPKDAVWVDPQAWGRSLRSELTEAKGVSFPVLVALTSDQLLIRARFPASLFFMPLIFDLEHRVARDTVRAQLIRDSWSRPGALLQLHGRELELRLRDAESLVEALQPAPAESLRPAAAEVAA
jgi:hypothetical protein